MTHDAVFIRSLSKTYAATGKSPAKTALQTVDLTIPRGMIYGLLGPNGAGKSTLINILSGMVLKSAGEVKIWDTDIDADPRQCRANIGVVPQELNFDPFFSPRRLLDLQAGLYGVPKTERKSLALLEMVGLADKADSYTRSLSGGMRRRLMVAKAMVHSPPILVLDEPTAGVDVELRHRLWENVRALNKRGVTVLLTTHYLEEAQELCDRIAIINHGKIIADEKTGDMLSRIDGKELRVTVRETIEDSLFAQFDGVRVRTLSPHSFAMSYRPQDVTVPALLEKVTAAGLTVLDISTAEPDLEDVFLHLTRSNDIAA